jgi:hypothetical protein
MILDAINTKLSVLITNGDIKELMRSGIEPPRTYPALSVSMGPDEPMIQQTSHMDQSLTINIDIIVTSNNVDLDRESLKVRLAAHKAIMEDQTLGLPFVINTNFSGQSEPSYKGDADTYAAITRLSWSVLYRTSIKDPSQ